MEIFVRAGDALSTWLEGCGGMDEGGTRTTCRQYVFTSAHATVPAKASLGSTLTLFDVTKPAADLDNAIIDLVIFRALLQAETSEVEAVVENARRLLALGGHLLELSGGKSDELANVGGNPSRSVSAHSATRVAVDWPALLAAHGSWRRSIRKNKCYLPISRTLG